MKHKKRSFKQEPSSNNSPWWERLRTRTGFADRTAWDWLTLLAALGAVVVSAVTVAWTTSQQSASQQQQAQEAAQQAYIAEIVSLFADSGYLRNEPDNEVQALARARTLRAIEQADLTHKKSIIGFLYDARLIEGADPAVSLSGANLTNVGLDGKDLSAVNLGGVNLSGANLKGTDLSNAHLSGARGVTNEKLEQQAKSLKDATMPNGQKYEEWLKSKNRKEDGKSGGSS